MLGFSQLRSWRSTVEELTAAAPSQLCRRPAEAPAPSHHINSSIQALAPLPLLLVVVV